MLSIIRFVIRYKTIFSLFLTVVVSLVLINGSRDMQQSVARMLMISVFAPFQVTIQKVTDIRTIYADNRRLHEQLAQLSIANAQYADQAAENTRLRTMLGFKQDFHYDLLPSRVVARDPSPQYRSLVINAGNQHALSRFMPVVTDQGVVGKIIQVMPGTSLVQTLKDPLSRISVMVKRSRIVGIMETETGDNFYIRHHTLADVNKGDTIVSSGLGGIYPRGFVVGTVSKVEDYNDPMFHKIVRSHITLAVDFDRLEELFVIRLEPQWSALCSELDSLGLAQ
jgi:rod shape-determining protein MreC